jgi:hypothetical protein
MELSVDRAPRFVGPATNALAKPVDYTGNAAAGGSAASNYRLKTAACSMSCEMTPTRIRGK